MWRVVASTDDYGGLPHMGNPPSTTLIVFGHGMAEGSYVMLI